MIPPGGLPTQIGRERVDRTFLADLDKGNLQLFMGAADPRSSRVYWAYKSVSRVASALTTNCSAMTICLDRFFPVSVSGEYLLGISQTGLTLENLDSISASLDALTLSLDSYASAVQPQIAQFKGSNVLGFFAGSPLEGTIESAEQGTDENRCHREGLSGDHGRGQSLWLCVLSRYATCAGGGAGDGGTRQCADRTCAI